MAARKALLYALWGLLFVVSGAASGIVVDRLLPGSASYAWLFGLVIWLAVWRAMPKWLRPTSAAENRAP